MQVIQTVWLLRHGWRQDFDNPDWSVTASRPHDPPLSPSGLKQAAETAAWLGATPIDHIFASPYLRTLQTAAIIAVSRGLRINVEPGFGEWLNPEWFPGMPDIVTEAEAFTSGISCLNRAYRSYAVPVYPEADEAADMFGRVERAMAGIMRDYSGTVLIVGHGSSIRQAARTLVDPPDGIALGTCALNRYDRAYDSGEWRLTHAAADHLSTSEEQLRFR